VFPVKVERAANMEFLNMLNYIASEARDDDESDTDSELENDSSCEEDEDCCDGGFYRLKLA
jgi:hypothetical protein